MLRSIIALALIAGLTFNASAQTAWQRLASKVAGTIQDRNSEVEEQTEAARNTTGEAPAVAGDDTTMVASLSPRTSEDGYARANRITGLAQSGKNSTLDLGLESEDPNYPFATNMFKVPEIRKLLGDQPRYVYDPQNMPDPMLMPWVRNAAVYHELNERAEAHLQLGELDAAIELYRRILALDDQRYSPEARAMISQIATEQQLAMMDLMQEEIEIQQIIELPPWVVDNTTGVIVGGTAETNMCLVGDHMLKVGDSVPDYPNVKVQVIERRKVVYKIDDKNFEVDLKDEM